MKNVQTPEKVEDRGNREFRSISVKEFVTDFVYRIDLDADYQREKIWTTREQQLLLDSIIKDIDIPKIYLVKVKNNEQFDFECIDGKQRISTFLRFFTPEPNETKPLTIDLFGKSYTYKQLKKEHPTIAEKLANYILDIIIFKSLVSENLIREIFIRLQLGRRLNSGELLKARTGTIRDFIFKEIGKSGPFLKMTNLSELRFSREFTLAQICINSFSKNNTGEFTRARLSDLEDFFEDNHDIDKNDVRLKRITDVLNLMDKFFDKKAEIISSRAIAVSAYLFCEELFNNKQKNEISKFAEFYEELLNTINSDMKQIREYKRPSNRRVLDAFQKYILQASVEVYSIKRRHAFLTKAFDKFQKTGKLVGN